MALSSSGNGIWQDKNIFVTLPLFFFLISVVFIPGEFFLQSRQRFWFYPWLNSRMSVPSSSGHPVAHHPPPHQGVQVRPG